MDDNTFTQGIEPGGLRTRNEIKILICYLVSRLKTPITKSQLTDIICDEGLANYFELNQALSEVIGNGNIRISQQGNDEILMITDIGKSNSDILEDDIPYSVREKAFNAAINYQTLLRRERENNIVLTELDNGYNISISVLDGSDEIMSVSLYAADYEQAMQVKTKYLSNPTKVYSGIISLLMA